MYVSIVSFTKLSKFTYIFDDFYKASERWKKHLLAYSMSVSVVSFTKCMSVSMVSLLKCLRVYKVSERDKQHSLVDSINVSIASFTKRLRVY